jgi:aspartate ammonia-lyase
MAFRVEEDFLGQKKILDELYYGVHTVRALENFNISGIRMSSQPVFIQAFAYVKKAAAMANRDCGILEPKLAHTIMIACDRVVAGELANQFVTDLIQGGAGTSVNMNVNEVIANLALEQLGLPKGRYDVVHPNNHVNCSQSTNDTYPTAIKLSVYKKTERYIEALEALRNSFMHKAEEFKTVLKMGRTQLQDAVPMMLGQEFHGFCSAVNGVLTNLSDVQSHFTICNMGGTAIGTMLNTPDGYPQMVTDYISELTGVPLTLSNDLVNASSDMGAYVAMSGAIRRSAVVISKICNDLRLLSSGPRCGLNEINLPQMQPGSSIMPGKVNPVIPEVVNQSSFYAIGADLTITMAAEAGQLELNVMEPVIAFSLFNALDYMTNAVLTLNERCIKGITANEKVCFDNVMNSVGIVTALNPYVGYETATEVAREALATGKSVHDIAVHERHLISQEKWDEIYSVKNLVHPHNGVPH